MSGRFHALVSALSQGVPGLVHGWSHKYRWLSDEYGVSDFVLDPYENPGTVEATVGARLGEIEAVRKSVAELATAKKAETEQMCPTSRSASNSECGGGQLLVRALRPAVAHSAGAPSVPGLLVELGHARSAGRLYAQSGTDTLTIGSSMSGCTGTRAAPATTGSVSSYTISTVEPCGTGS